MGLIETEKRLLPANPMIAGLAPGVATTDRIAWVRLSSVTLPLHSPISDAKVLTGRQKPMTKIAFLFAEIETEEGYSGIGFSYSKRAGGPGQYMHAKEIADELIGEDPNDIARLWDELVWAGASVGRSGLSTQAIAAFDIALWDLKAKRADLPLAKLLGAYRDSVQCYNTSGGFLSMDIGEVKERVSVAIDKGIGGIKLKVGQPDPMIDLQRIEAVRKHIGGNVPLMIDANQQWDRPTAHRFGRIVEQYNLTWIEEPLDASYFGRVKNYPDICEGEICVLVQIETRLGLDNLEAIASVAGIDGVFIGPGDLAASLGHAGNPKHPEVLAAVESAIERIRACGKPLGILTGDEQLAHHYIKLGCLFTAVGSDQALLARGSEELAQRFLRTVDAAGGDRVTSSVG